MGARWLYEYKSKTFDYLLMKQKLFFIIIILSLLSSCCAKKSVIETKEVVKIDSVFVTKEVVKRFKDTLKIESPCDSLGQLKPFKRSIIVPQGNITIEGINNEINGNIDLKGYENTIERKYKNIYEKKMSEIVKSKTPFYHWIIHILCVLIIFLLLRLR